MRKSAGSHSGPSVPGRFSLLFTHGSRETARKSSVLFRPAPLGRTRGETMRKLTREQKRDIAAIAAKKDEEIDFSDVPAYVDWSGAEFGKFYRTPMKNVTMRLASDDVK